MKNTNSGAEFIVRLTDGIFKNSQETGMSFIMSLDPDRLLAPIAYCTGASNDRTKYYGGWEAYSYRGYSGTGITGHSLGHWLSAMAYMYNSTGDEKIRERLYTAIDKLERYQNIDGSGFIGGFDKKGFERVLAEEPLVSSFEISGYWVPWYSLHKIYQGLIDAYKLAGSKKALSIVCKFADWAITATTDMTNDRFNKMLRCEYGGMNEAMAELYDITGEKKYFDLAVRFSQKEILEPLSKGLDKLEGMHANTQIPKVLGAAAVYDADNRYNEYRKAAEFFYETVVGRRSYVIGGNSNREHFGNEKDETLGTQTLETCNTYNMMKLAEYLYRWEHKSEYMDFYERALFNHILASQDPESGEKTYFMSTKPGHFKVYSDALNGNSFWCCTGSGMENPGRYTRNIYYHEGNVLYVNQFIASSADWVETGLKLSQITEFPYDDTSMIRIDHGEANAVINIRIPAWIAAPAAIRVNDEAAVMVSKNGYYTISRKWKTGDTIYVTLPMALHTYTAREPKHRVAFMYGPVVLAATLGKTEFPETDRVDDHTSLDHYIGIDVESITVNNKNPDTFIELKNNKRLEFEMNTVKGNVKLIPYADLHHERYTLYWDLYLSGENEEKDNFAEGLDKITIDVVRPNEQQSEIDHNLYKINSCSGYDTELSMGWRSIKGADGCFSYDMNIPTESETLYLTVLYKDDDSLPDSGLKVFAENFSVGEHQSGCHKEQGLLYVYYKLPDELTKDKHKLTVKFAPSGNKLHADRVYEVRITNSRI